MTLEEFKKISEDEIRDLTENEVEFLFRMSNIFSNFALKKWANDSLIKQAEK